MVLPLEPAAIAILATALTTLLRSANAILASVIPKNPLSANASTVNAKLKKMPHVAAILVAAARELSFLGSIVPELPWLAKVLSFVIPHQIGRHYGWIMSKKELGMRRGKGFIKLLLLIDL